MWSWFCSLSAVLYYFSPNPLSLPPLPLLCGKQIRNLPSSDLPTSSCLLRGLSLPLWKKTNRRAGKRDDCYSVIVKCPGCSANSTLSACINLALRVGCSMVLCPATRCSCRGNSTQAPGPMGRYSNTHALDDKTTEKEETESTGHIRKKEGSMTFPSPQPIVGSSHGFRFG